MGLLVLTSSLQCRGMTSHSLATFTTAFNDALSIIAASAALLEQVRAACASLPRRPRCWRMVNSRLQVPRMKCALILVLR